MKQNLLIFIGILFLTSTVVDAQVLVEWKKGGVVSCFVKNPNQAPMNDVPVVLAIENPDLSGAVVYEGETEIASQYDILDNNKTRELVFVVDLKPKQTRIFKVYFSRGEISPNRYKSRVNAQMFLKEDGKIVPKDVITATEDNMYNSLHHHGPAFESDMTSYRIYFDQKQTIDIYGKVVKRLELPTTMWYPTDQQLIDKYGDDVLYVGGSAGLGALKGWDGTKTSHISSMTKREAKVLAKGPIRAVVDMNVENWDYQGKKINLNSRYYQYAGHRDAEVRHTLSGDGVQNMTFATGVQKLRRGDVMHTDSKGMVADWGRDFPVTDTVKYPQQTVGLAISIPAKYVVSQAQDKLNYLYVVKPDERNEIKYRITFGAQKEEFGYKTSDAFFKYVDDWTNDKPAVISVK